METLDPRQMTETQLAGLGTGQVGYIRQVETPEGRVFALFGADGSSLATAQTAEAALFAAQHLDIDPISLH